MIAIVGMVSYLGDALVLGRHVVGFGGYLDAELRRYSTVASLETGDTKQSAEASQISGKHEWAKRRG